MNRELASALVLQSQRSKLLGRTWSKNSHIKLCSGVSDIMNSETSFSLNDSESEQSGCLDRIEETNLQFSKCDRVYERQKSKRLKRSPVVEEPLSNTGENPPVNEEPNGNAAESPTEKELKGNLADHTILEESKCDLVKSICESELKSVLAQSLIKEEAMDISVNPLSNVGSVGTSTAFEDNGKVRSSLQEKPQRRFTRSQLKPETEPVKGLEPASVSKGIEEKPQRRFTRPVLKPETKPVEVLEPAIVSSAVTEDVDVKRTTAGNALKMPKKKLESKMSQKIALSKIPSCVKELLETGMLEGFPVTYIGPNKGSVLQGTIKGLGILCTCSLCKGCTVVTPSKFEKHACKAYLHMSKYIYLGNGRTLQEVLKLCKNSPLETLEASIQNAIGSLHVTKPTNCARCKELGSLCNSCKNQKNTHDSSSHTPITTARSSKSLLISSSSDRGRLRVSSQNNSQGRITRSSSKSPLISKASASALMSVLPQDKSQGRIERKATKSVSFTKSSDRALMSVPSQNLSQGKITRKDQNFHKCVFEEDGLPDGTELAYYSRGQKILEGYKKGFGIFCCCCNCEVSASQFEAHAGHASRKKPYSNIYTSNGVSLHELAISLSKERKLSSEYNDDLCIICADGGRLLLCDGCPRAFHKECASLSSVPRGNWYCKYCENMFQRERYVKNNANALAAGRVLGVDPIEQIQRRAIRIITNLEAEVSGCALCRACDFSKAGFGPRTIILCDQCEMEFHVGCLKDHNMADLKELPEGAWFCSINCRRISSTLQKLLATGAEKLPGSLLNDIKRKYEETEANLNVQWRLLSGKVASSETRTLLSKAVSIFHDCFDPIIDATTGRDLIPSMVYGRNSRGQEFGGMYCGILTVNSSIVSVGIFRVFGQLVAELPLVATSNDKQGKGYFKALFSCIERLLAFLKVKMLVLPAATEAEAIWIDKFGFQKIPPDQLSKYRRNCQMMKFQGTTMLQKMVPECRIVPEKMR